MSDRYFDDFGVGETFDSQRKTVSEAEILDFALRFDPQPIHMDALSAAETEFGGIIASGFHMLALSFSLFFRTRVLEASNMGSPGIEEVKWHRPLKPGDTIWTRAEVTRLKRSRSKPDRGIVFMRHDTFNQQDALIMTVHCLHRLKARPR